MSMFSTDYASRNNIWVQEAKRATDSANVRLKRAQLRINELEKALEVEKKGATALVAVARTIIAELEKIDPCNPLTNKANRDKIYDANYKL